MKFKWFSVIYNHGLAYYVDFKSRAFREVEHPHVSFSFDYELGRTMMREARAQGVKFSRKKCLGSPGHTDSNEL